MSIEGEGPLPTSIEDADENRATRIRLIIRDLNAEVLAAKNAGLAVQLELAMLGMPTWNGHVNAAKISRRY